MNERYFEEYKKLCVEHSDKWRTGVSQFQYRCWKLAERLGIDKEMAKQIVNTFPFATKKYYSAQNVTIAEISPESGVWGIHLVRPNLAQAKFLKIASPFLDANDIVKFEQWIKPNVPMFVLTDEKSARKMSNVFRPNTTVLGIDLHAKLLLTERVALLGSMNFYEKGMSPKKSIELVVVFRDPKIVADLNKRFDWWMERVKIEKMRR